MTLNQAMVFYDLEPGNGFGYNIKSTAIKENQKTGLCWN